MSSENDKGALKGRWGYELGPEDIEGESFRIISGLADLEQLTPAEVALVKRVIHATGDPLFSELVMWSPDAVAKGIVYVPEDRGKQGAITALPIFQNVTLPSLGRTSKNGS